VASNPEWLDPRIRVIASQPANLLHLHPSASCAGISGFAPAIANDRANQW